MTAELLAKLEPYRTAFDDVAKVFETLSTELARVDDPEVRAMFAAELAPGAVRVSAAAATLLAVLAPERAKG